MTFDWFCREDDEELPDLPGRPGVGRLRKKRTTPAVAAVAALAGAGTPAFVPIGPSAALFGATVRRAPVAGRVRALAVSDDGRRAYAGTPGGLWYTADAGVTWIPLDAAASSRALDGELHDARALPVSALSVQFGAATTGADDVVFAGTGDPALESAIGPDGGRGVGVRTAVGPVPQVAAGNSPWALEAKNLAGAIVLALVRDRANDIWAATTDGLYKRPAANRDNWQRVFGGLVWDVDVTRGIGVEPQRLWVASEGKLQWSSDGANFTDVALPDEFPLGDRERPPIGRIRLAAAREADPPRVWALAAGARLWRVEPAGVFPVDGVPDDLSGLRRADRADLGLAIACAQGNPNDVIVGGGATRTATPDRPASVYRAVVLPAGAGPAARWTFFGGGSGETRVAPALVGIGVPAGVHAIALPAGMPRDVWIATDEGVFRSSDRGGAFESRSVGLAAFQIEQIGDHGRAESLLVGGAQVSGILRAAGLESWATEVRYGGGGVAIDPANGLRIAAQRRGAAWFLSSDARAFAPVRWFTMPAGATPDIALAYDVANREEDRWSAPASTPAAVVAGDRTQLAIGTRRVWYTEDWGVTWRTLPTIAQDPSALDAAGRGPRTDQDLVDGELRVLRWGTTDQLYALTTTHVYLYRRTPGAGAAPATWARATVYDGPSLRPRKRKALGNQIPPEMPLTSLAVHEPARGRHGSLYATTARSFERDDERHVWWFDGDANWYECGLDVSAAAYAVAIDPASPGRVFVGTAVGVYRGVFQAPANPGDAPAWNWTRASAGLPEAPCVALSVHAGARLLRAAIWGRGVFEAPLDGALAEPATVVFLLAHDFDWRRRAIPATPRAPFSAAAAAPPYAEADYRELRLDASPDIRVRRAPGEPPPALLAHPSAFAEGQREPRTFEAFAIGAALRRAGDAVVPVSGIEDASFGPAVERRLQREEANTAANWHELNGRGTVANVYPLDAAIAFSLTVGAAPAPTTERFGVAGNPFAGRNPRGLVLRFGNAVREAANRGVSTIITGNTDNELTFARLPAVPAPNDAFEIEEKTPGTSAATEAIVHEPDARGICSCQTHTGRTLVDVTVRTRSGPIAAGRVRVALLRGPFAGVGAAVAPLPNTWVASLRNDVGQPAANRGAWLPAGWSYFDDATREILTVARVLDARTPAVVTFDGSLPEGNALLFAAVIAEDDLPNAATGTVLTLAREARHVALRSVRAFAQPAVTNFAFFDWHTQAPVPGNAADYRAPAPVDRQLVRLDAEGRLRPKPRLHLCFMEHAVSAFEVTFPPGTLWDASWSIVDSAGTVVAWHPNFPAARAAIANGSYAWKWDGRHDPTPPLAAPRRGRLVVEGLYRSRLVIERRVAGGGGPTFEYTAEILAEGKPYHIFVEGVPKNDAEIRAMIGAGDVYRNGGGADDVGQRIPRDCWILAYRGQMDAGHCVFLGQGIIEATEVDAGPLAGAVATPHDREYKGYVRRDPGEPAMIVPAINRPDRCQIADLGPSGEIALRNAGAAPNNPYATGAAPGLPVKRGVQAHPGSAIWSVDALSVGCTGVSPLAGSASELGMLRSIGSVWGGWGVAGENAALGGPAFVNKQTKRAAATNAEARIDALLADDHARPVLDPPALAGGVEPLHLQDTFQKAAFGGFLQGELPYEVALVDDEPAADADREPQARMRCILRDYRRGSAYHIYHHAVIVRHQAAPALPNYNVELWVPRKVIRGWNSAIPGDDHTAPNRPTMADRRHHDPLPENRRNVLVRDRLRVRWYIRHTPAAGPPNPPVYLIGAAGFQALLPGRRQATWVTGGPLAPGVYESVCEYRLQVEPHGAGHEWHPELAVRDVLSANDARLEAETIRVDAATGDVFLDGRAVVAVVTIP